MASRTLRSIRPIPTSPACSALAQGLRVRQFQSPSRYALEPRRLQSRVFARCQSTSDVEKRAPAPARKQSTELPTVGAIIRRGLDFSAVFSVFGKGGFRKLYRDSPGELILAIIALGGVTGVALYTVYLYFTYFYDTQFTKFPPDVAKSLRRALYYTNIKPDPKLAHKYYKRALEQCDAAAVDPFSDEVLGIRIQTAAWLEKIGNYDGAVTVLEGISRDCLRWVESMEKAMAEGTLPKTGKVPIPSPDAESSVPQEQQELPENLWRKRTRLLAKAVGTNVKLGELNADEHMMRPEDSQDRLTWAVETALKELKRRHDEGVKEDEGPWMSASEIGGALESLAQSYERRSQFQLAVPLLFHALRLCDVPCHRPVIMNNLAVSFAQHPAELPIIVTPGNVADEAKAPSPGTVSREEHLEYALNWANNALAHATDVKGDDRTPECDEACAVSLCNLGDISLLLGKLPEARRHFEKSIKMSRDLDLSDTLKRARDGLDRAQAQSS